MIYIINTFLSNTFDFCFFLSVNVSGKHKNTTETNQRFSHQLQGTYLLQNDACLVCKKSVLFILNIYAIIIPNNDVLGHNSKHKIIAIVIVIIIVIAMIIIVMIIIIIIIIIIN